MLHVAPSLTLDIPHTLPVRNDALVSVNFALTSRYFRLRHDPSTKSAVSIWRFSCSTGGTIERSDVLRQARDRAEVSDAMRRPVLAAYRSRPPPGRPSLVGAPFTPAARSVGRPHGRAVPDAPEKKGGVDAPPFTILIGCRNQKPTLTPTMNACPASSEAVPSPSYSTSWYDATSLRPGPMV